MAPIPSRRLPAAPVALLLGLAAPLGAQEAAEGPHIFEFFLGATHADHRGQDETAFSLGGQYRHDLGNGVSMGLLAEYAFDPFDSWVVGVPVVFSLGDSGWQFTAMPGAEIEGGSSEFLIRVGIGYEIDGEAYSIKPEINFDWVADELAIVAGVSIGFRR